MPDWGIVARALIKGGNNLPHWKGGKATLTFAGSARGLIASGLDSPVRNTHDAKAAETTVGDCIWANEAGH